MSDKTLSVELVDALLWKINMLAYLWRGQPESSLRAQALVHDYHETLLRLMELGLNDGLGLEAELPDRLMPDAYLKMRDQLMATGTLDSEMNMHAAKPVSMGKAPNGTGKYDAAAPKNEERHESGKQSVMTLKLK